MSVTIMAEVWPLDLGTSDKLVLLCLADSANDEDARTWIPVESRIKVNRFGRRKLDILTKTGLGIRTVQGAIKRLEKAGHITRLEHAGKGCEYWVHPVLPETETTPADSAGVQNETPAADSPTPAGDAGGPRSSCGETINNQNQPSAGARTRGSRRPAPSPAIEGAGASLGEKVLPPVDAKSEEDDRCKAIREEISKIVGKSNWHTRPNGAITRCGLKLHEIVGDRLGLEVIAPPGSRDTLQVETSLFESAATRTGLNIGWVNVCEGKVTRHG